MKITKFNQSCLLVEMPAPVNRTVLFDPGVMSETVLQVDSLEFLDNIIITHDHADHMSLPLLRRLVAKFPNVRITTTEQAVQQLRREEIMAAELVSEDTPGVLVLESPHEPVEPLFATPQQIGVHYLDMLTHPGDSHSFSTTRPILALPITAPWGATVTAVKLALQLRPQHVLPIHDWHWSDEARQQMYDDLEPLFAGQGITFHKLEIGKPVVIQLADNADDE